MTTTTLIQASGRWPGGLKVLVYFPTEHQARQWAQAWRVRIDVMRTITIASETTSDSKEG